MNPIATKTATITNGGGTLTLSVATEQYAIYLLRGTATLAAGYNVVASAPPTKPTTFRIFYNGNVTVSAGNNITIFGTVLTAEQALRGLCMIEVIYDFTSAAWVASVSEGFNDESYEGVTTTPIVLGGTTVAITKNSKQWQRFTGNGVLAGDQSATTSGTYNDGQIFFLQWSATVTKGAATISLLGATLTAKQAATGNILVISCYDLANTTFRTQIIEPADTTIEGLTTTALVLGGTTVTLTNASNQWQVLTGNGVLAGNQTVASSGAFTTGQTFYTKFDATVTKGAFVVSILGATLTANQALYGSILVISVYNGAGWNNSIVANDNATFTESVIVPVSFAATKVCDNSFIAPCNGVLTNLDSFVVLALSATDAGTITSKINGVAVTNGQITVPLSSALNTQNTATPSALNTFVKGDIIALTTAKVTPNGECLVTVRYTRTS